MVVNFVRVGLVGVEFFIFICLTFWFWIFVFFLNILLLGLCVIWRVGVIVVVILTV